MGEFRLYRVRFAVLLSVCLTGFAQNLAWFTFAGFPVATSAFFGISPDSFFNVSFTLLLGPIGYLACFWAVSWLLDKRGIRLVILLAAVATLLCSALRLVAVFVRASSAAWPLVCLGQFFNALAGFLCCVFFLTIIILTRSGCNGCACQDECSVVFSRESAFNVICRLFQRCGCCLLVCASSLCF